MAMLLLALPASAMADPPANDNFVNRQVLTAGFPGGEPVELTASNLEATKEKGEFIPGLSAAGNSIWFEWEATSEGWVSVGVCETEFPSLVGVFTGTEVKALTPVASGNGSEGPDCPFSGRQYTFKATAGTKYAIAADGNNFHLPEAPEPVTEGNIDLRIEETPVPPNDEFEDATEVSGEVFEEPGGDRWFFANARGFNWTASTEHGEPREDSSGASVWYSLTVPDDATYSFGQPCCQAALSLDLDLYLGDAVDELAPLAVGGEGAKVDLTAGETVRIRVSGPIEEGAEEPAVANFDFNVAAKLAPLEPPPPTPDDESPLPPSLAPPLVSPDTTAPRTTIRKRVAKRVPAVTFTFGSSEPGSTFRCGLDGRKLTPCAASKRVTGPMRGRHVLRVVAVDAAGNADPTPAVARFRLPPAKRQTGAGGLRE